LDLLIHLVVFNDFLSAWRVSPTDARKMEPVMDKPNLTPEQIREQLSMDIVLKLGQMGYKLDDDGLLAVCTAAYDITKQVTKKS
jgi:hypothetical protein